jgi:Mg2+ and Co2+ transporter CorA
MTVVDNAVYSDGQRYVTPESLETTDELLREHSASGSPCVVETGQVHVFLGKDFVITIRHAAEPDLRDGYPMALGLMLLIAVLLYVLFRRRGWL